MFYVILMRILRRHALFHLVIPLVVGLLVEAIYMNFKSGTFSWKEVSTQLLSDHSYVLYLGVVAAYITVIGLLIRSETTIGLRRIDLYNLVVKLRGATSLFAVAPTPLDEWFDPAAQVYLATLLGERLSSTSAFRYERVLLMPSRKSRKYLNSDYLEGYFARCLISIHKHLGISLYFLEWEEVAGILSKLNTREKILIGYYPPFVAHLPKPLVKALMLPVRRRRVRRIACGVIETSAGPSRVFSFTKRENVVDVEVQPEARAKAYLKFVKKIKEVLYEDKEEMLFEIPEVVKPIHDFTKYYAE